MTDTTAPKGRKVGRPRAPNKRKTITFRLHPSVRAGLEARAERDHRSVSAQAEFEIASYPVFEARREEIARLASTEHERALRRAGFVLLRDLAGGESLIVVSYQMLMGAPEQAGRVYIPDGWQVPAPQPKLTEADRRRLTDEIEQLERQLLAARERAKAADAA